MPVPPWETSPPTSRLLKRVPFSSEQEEYNQDLGESDRFSFASHTDYPGDGICPTVSEFNQVFTATYKTWNLDSFPSNEDGFNVICIESFLGLVRGLPHFTAPPCDNISACQTEDELKVECAVRWKTTEHTQCDQTEKLIQFRQLLGYADPPLYNICDRAPAAFLYSEFGLDQGSVFSCLILGWSYVLCCRWVEILQSSGHKAFLRHKSSDVTESTWHLILGSHWEAVLIQNEESFYSPWMLQLEIPDSERLFRTFFFVFFLLVH